MPHKLLETATSVIAMLGAQTANAQVVADVGE
jgi:hypothetical protein